MDEEHDLCKPRELGHALEAERVGPGVWSWNLENVREGVVVEVARMIEP